MVEAAVAHSDGMLRTTGVAHSRGPYLAPIERPRSLLLKVAYWFMRRQFGKVMGPVAVFSARMPWGFTSFSMKVAKLDKKLVLPRDTAILVREKVAGIN